MAKMEISPELAAQILLKKNCNRPISRFHVDTYANLMTNGQWVYNGEAIKFDKDGNLIDGQHRLSAIIKSGVTVTTEVVYDLDPIVFTTLDQGKKRSLADLIAIGGADWWVEKSALSRSLYFYDSFRFQTKKYLNSQHKSQVIYQFYLDNQEEIDDTVMHCRHFKKNRNAVLDFSRILFLYHILTKIDKPSAMKFIDDMIHGYGLTPGSPIAAVRESLIAEKMYNKYRISTIIIYDLVFRAWNLYRKGKTIKAMKANFDVEELPTLI